jgi:thymidylate synthase
MNQDQYQSLIERVMVPENIRPTRAGVDAYKTTGEVMIFPDVSKAFPATTLKKLAFIPIKGETCGFLRAVTSAADFRALKCNVWNQNANEHGKVPNPWLDNPFRKGADDCGPIYGDQWRNWLGYKVVDACIPNDSQAEVDRKSAIHGKLESEGWVKIGDTEEIVEYTQFGRTMSTPKGVIYYKSIDQLGECLRQIIKTPDSRRILFHGWNPAVLDEVCLPACHLLYQFLPDSYTKELNMVVFLRSNDLGLGAPFNMAEAASIMHIVGRLTGYKPKKMSYFIGDAHIYVNQVEYLTELMSNEPKVAPTLWLNPRIPTYDADDNGPLFMDDSGDTQIDHLVEWLELVEPDDLKLEGYDPHILTTPVPPMVV